MEWKKYQVEVAEFFRELGLNATTDAPVKGVRTGHDVDVLVEANYMGITVKWIVECKRWKTRVTKLHVLELRTIVNDVGADRGFVMSERGHQKGAREAAFLSNVQLTSLQDLRETCGHELGLLRVRKLYQRAGECKARYWW